MNYKIVMILPYFGKLPNYFDLWLQSAEKNSTIDWLIYTDDFTAYNYPSNVRVVYLTWDELKQRVQSKFDFKVALDTPYKLCDFKPTYGEVFSEDISEYDFWGYCDPDCIWGDIRKFVTDDILSRYNKIMIHGHWAIYRNTEEVSKWYKTLEPREYHKQVFSSIDSFAFDEGEPEKDNNNFNNIVSKNGHAIYWDYVFDDVWPKYNNFIAMRAINYARSRGYGDNIRNIMVGYHYIEGKLFGEILIDGKIEEYETMYVHLQKRKMKRDSLNNTLDYYIFPNYFVSDILLTPKYMKKACRHKKINIPHLLIRYKNLKRKIKRFFSKG